MFQDKVFIYADFSQLELRCAAHLSKDPSFLKAFNEGLDLHEKTAKAFFKEKYNRDEHRQVGKRSNFLLIYNGSAKRLKDQLWEDIQYNVSLDVCKTWRDDFFNTYPRYKEFLDEEREFAVQHFGMISMFGRIRRLPDLKFAYGLDHKRRQYVGEYGQELSNEFEQLPEEKRFVYLENGHKRRLTLYDLASKKVRHAFNQAYNFPIQSMAASIVKRAMLALDARGYDIVNQVHDAVFIQVHRDMINTCAEDVKMILERTTKIDVPLIVDMKILNSFDDEDICENLLKKVV